jgi:serine/threonine protein kinase/tetratricopeptide (TPR) repeat protein
MTPERWEQIHDVLQKALELAPGERSAFLNQACSSDPSLRQEVDTLLASSDDVRSSFLLQFSGPRVTLTAGTRLGEYEVKSLLGSGGMGEVYRARDSRLGRDVAIKVLPPFVSSDPNRLRRFEQEARAAAALNHPNILAVYQMGTYEGAPYLVSELLEGETLREPIRRGRLAVRKAIDYGVQIARGLAAAHEKGIVHRDLKPENLFVTKDGRLKILDFGLAKLTQPQSSSENSALTLTEGTEAGVVMGTVGYMSPEQVRGQPADHRADIFAFGAILYEMLAGKRAFQKPTSPETMTAILNEDPPGISGVTPNLPPSLQRVVHRCLEKNPEQRFQSASDLAFALDALSDSGSSSSDSAVHGATGAGRRWKIIVPATVTGLTLSIGAYFVFFHHKPKLTDKDTIVVADFANSTGDPIFDDTLKTALGVSLQQSPFLSVLPDSTVTKTLQMMTRPPDAKLTPDVTRELCQRAGSKAYISGSIGSLGSEFVVGLKAINCQSGDSIAQEQVTAASKEKVLEALGEAAAKLRGELGESLATVQKFDVPLEQATTSSLEALKAYSLSFGVYNRDGSAASMPYLLRAIELDPNFAAAYNEAGISYSYLNQQGRAGEYFGKAFQLRGHASERERLDITANYYQNVTGDLDKAIQVFLQETESYPRTTEAYINLGIAYASQGQYEKAVEITKHALRLAPGDIGCYDDLTNFALDLQHFDEARQIIQAAHARTLDNRILHIGLYALAFLGTDPAAMAEQQQWFAGQPNYENLVLALASDTEAYGGHLGKARELTKRAVDSAIRADNKESGAVWQANAAVQQAAYGNAAEARQTAEKALKLAPASQSSEVEAALAFAMAGDAARAETLAQDLGKRFPLDTQMQSLWLPAIQAQLALDRKNPVSALTALRATTPIELGNISWVVNGSCLYHVYVRGEAYLAAGNGTAAAAEFQKILDHSGIVWNCWTGALAHLGVARANALQSRTSQGADADAARVRALAAYKDFLTLWKDADSDIPILKQAKAEYAKLQ